MDRRIVLKTIAGGAAGLMLSGSGRVFAQAAGPFSLPPLGYAYEALEPHIDTTTMTIHHQRHHGAFIGNLNTFAGQFPALTQAATEDMLRNLASVPETIRAGVRNNLGGHWNHAHFWDVMTPGGVREPAGDLAAAINTAFGDLGQMRQRFNAAGMGRFGSGWAWLIVGQDRRLAVVSTPNQDNPLMDGARGVVIGCDVWEHAYYLKYQNRRADYMTTWWNTVNWTKASANFARAMA